MPSFADINPLGAITQSGGLMGLSSFATILLVFFIAVIILCLGGVLVYWFAVKKQYWIKIHVFRLIGNVPTRVAIYTAKEVPFGMAGDKLWRVASSGLNKIKVIKWLPVGKIQTAPREFWYYIREDGEWINFQMDELNKISKDMGIHFVQEDMRLQRLATERLLEQRLLDKTFWEKWGTTVMLIMVFLVISVCMVVMFFQFAKLLDKFTEVASIQADTSKLLLRVFGENYMRSTGNWSGGQSGLIPA